MSCVHKSDSACPFAQTQESEIASNYGCLPTIQDIEHMRNVHSKTWACHDNPMVPCKGALIHLKQKRLPYKVVDVALVTEKSPWHLYCS